jgi:transposase
VFQPQFPVGSKSVPELSSPISEKTKSIPKSKIYPMRKYSKISDETRERIVHILENNLQSRSEVAISFSLPYSTVCEIYNAFNKAGRVVMPQRGGSRNKKLSEVEIRAISRWLEEDCTLTLREIQRRISIVFNIQVSVETVRNYLKGFNFTLKRVHCVPQAADTDELWLARRDYSLWFCRTNVRNGNVIFIDESGFQLTLRRGRGRSQKGKRSILIVPRTRTKNLSVIAGMSALGVEHFKVLDGNGNTAKFLHFLHELFQKLCNENRAHCILVMDNVRFHRVTEVGDVIRNAGHEVIYLPPYSPFLNPIENLFHQWKSIIRSRAPNTDAELLTSIHAVDSITQQNCASYVEHVFQNCVSCIAGERNFNLT